MQIKGENAYGRQPLNLCRYFIKDIIIHPLVPEESYFMCDTISFLNIMSNIYCINDIFNQIMKMVRRCQNICLGKSIYIPAYHKNIIWYK